MLSFKESRVVKNKVFSCMDDPEHGRDMLDKLDFDVVLAAMNATNYGGFADIILPVARKKNVGAIAMKVMKDLVGVAATPQELLMYAWKTGWYPTPVRTPYAGHVRVTGTGMSWWADWRGKMMKKVKRIKSGLLLLVTSVFAATPYGCSVKASFPDEIRFYIDQDHKSEDPVEKLTYGLFITAPWEEGGVLYLNFPEHLEYNPVGNTILRHYDTIPNPWIISQDGKQASYRVQSLELENVYVESFARVLNKKELPFDARGVKVSMKIINQGSQTLPVIRPLICNQFKGLTGFPQRHHDFTHNYIVIDDQITSLADLPTENMDTEFKGCVVRNCPQRDTRAERSGGLIEKEMDAALSIVTSEDQRRKVIFWWNPGKSMIANAFIPCIHADPYFGTLRPGEEASAEGLILFTEGELEPIVRYLKAPR